MQAPRTFSLADASLCPPVIFCKSREGFLTGLAWQGGWIVALSFACLSLWRAGLAKVLREGGV